jgi:hypothetical protein
MLMARMRTGFAVIGDTQFLPGYSILLHRDPGIEQLTDLDTPDRVAFLLDMTLLGAAVQGPAARTDCVGSTTRFSVT